MFNIPEFTGGVRSPFQYNAGRGLSDSRKIDDPDSFPYFTNGQEMTDLEFRHMLADFDDRQIPFSFQFPQLGSISVRMFHNKRAMDLVYRDGKATYRFVDDYMPLDEQDTLITTYTGCDAGAYREYVALLEKKGFDHSFSNTLEDNMFDEFVLKEGMLRLSFICGTVRIAEETVGVPVREFSEGEPYGKPVVYQYGLYHAPNRGYFTMDCGMCYIVALPDGTALMVDGGYQSQLSLEAVNGLRDLLHSICGEKIRLKWYCTHAHCDHSDMLAKMLRMYHDEIVIEKVMFNFPDTHNHEHDPNVIVALNRIRKYYPDVIYRKIHSGDVIVLGGCRIEVIQTHEDNTGAEGNELMGWMNDTSTVLKIRMDPDVTNGDADFLLLGDMDRTAEKAITSHYTSATLHSGMVQAAHHLFNALETLYDVVDADIALIPQGEKVRTNHDKQKYEIIARTVPYDGFYFSNSGTDSFRVEGGKIVHVSHEPRKGGVYEGSDL